MISKYSYTKRTTPIEIGKKYGRLTVLAKTSRRKGTSYYYQCRCDCGKECYVTSGRLGVSTMSCGCLKEECRGSHRESQTRLYRIWCLMKARCYNPNFPEYGNYGGRGIKISPDWRSNYPNFKIGRSVQDMTSICQSTALMSTVIIPLKIADGLMM